jgi:hypothetical protein
MPSLPGRAASLGTGQRGQGAGVHDVRAGLVLERLQQSPTQLESSLNKPTRRAPDDASVASV